MTLILTLALFGSMPTVYGEIVDQCEVLEVNHVYDDEGNEVLTQLLGWDWDREACKYQVVFWRLLKSEGMHPQFNYATQRYTSNWYDGDIHRIVQSKKRWERWMPYDIETKERGIYPQAFRRGLVTPQRNEPSESDLVP